MNFPEGSAEAELAAVLQQVEPIRAAPDRDARVLAQVLARRRGRSQSALPRLLRPAIVAAILLAAIATATAMMQPAWKRLASEWLTQSEQPARPLRVAGAAPRTTRAAEAPARSEMMVPTRALERRHNADSPVQVAAAVRALRSENDPARAKQLALSYLRRHPHGALAEEALAIAIEGGVRAADGQTSDLAAAYLRAYPTGRFRQVAEQIIDHGRR